MTRIVTLTLNPALDLTTSVDRMVGGHKLRCTAPTVAPGGGGVNVARVAQRLGAEVVAVLTSGGTVGARHRALLEAEGVPARVVPVDGETRESIAVDETSTGEQYRFVLPGPHLSDAEWRACLDAAVADLRPGDVVVGSGSLPPGVPDDAYAQLARLSRARGALVAVDASGSALAAALAAGVDIVKPSRRELELLSGRPLESEAAQEAAAREIVDAGGARLVALTLGADGAVLVSSDGVDRGPAHAVERRSTIGAGDSFLAAFLVRYAEGGSHDEALRWALAAGAAAASRSGAELCDAAETARLVAASGG